MIAPHILHDKRRLHWHTVKFVTTVGVLGILFVPAELAAQVAVAVNLFWIWVEP